MNRGRASIVPWRCGVCSVAGLLCSRVRALPWLKYSPPARSGLGHRDRRLG